MKSFLVLSSFIFLLPLISCQLGLISSLIPQEIKSGLDTVVNKLPEPNIDSVAQVLKIPSPNISFENYNPRELFDKIPDYGRSWMYFPDGDGNPVVAQLNMSDYSPRASFPGEQYATFHLYTRANPDEDQLLELDNITSIKNSNFNFSAQTKFIIHGWTSNYKSDTSQTLKNNFLLTDNSNVILVDWSKIASNVIYIIPAMETKNIGDYIGQMVDFLVANGGDLTKIHIIGHSLGAHIAGRSGHAVKSGKVERITGLDPALPGFELVAPNDDKLDKSDAKFVDVIHTCGGVLGYYSKLGHVDYYPNGGTPSQPGCIGLPQIIEGCSHGRAWQYFAESIKQSDGFMAVECESWHAFKLGLCENNTQAPMGYAAPEREDGVFYLRTQDKPPFIHTAIYKVINITQSGVSQIRGLADNVVRALPNIGGFSNCPKRKISNYDISRFNAQSRENFNTALRGVSRDEVTFRLWTRDQSKNFVPLYYGHLLDEPSIRRDKPFKFIIHGWSDCADAEWYEFLRDEFLKKDDYNIIQVDWRKPAGALYPISVEYTTDVGQFVGELIIDFNQTLGIPYENFHLIGHSLGAHISGFAGKLVTKNTGKIIGRITGMDPAGPLFLLSSAKNRLDRGDANFVDIIHTDGLKYGYDNTLGHADFYPNGGRAPQPGCAFYNYDVIDVASCSHTRSYYLFGESINSNDFLAHECSTYKKYKKGECTENTSAIMGENIDFETRGVFYLQTNAESPFARNGLIS